MITIHLHWILGDKDTVIEMERGQDTEEIFLGQVYLFLKFWVHLMDIFYFNMRFDL